MTGKETLGLKACFWLRVFEEDILYVEGAALFDGGLSVCIGSVKPHGCEAMVSKIEAGSFPAGLMNFP